MRRRLETIRKLSQAAFLLLFGLLFLLTVYPPSGRPVDLFLRTDPLAAGSALLAARHFPWDRLLWLLPLVGLALVAGRAFCGWICPLGTLVDCADGLARRRRPLALPGPRRAKYYLLAALLAAALLGAQLAYLADPLVLLTRSFALGLFAPLQAVARAVGLGNHPLLPESQAYYRFSLLALVMLGAILGLAVVGRRYWCRMLCPLGALYGLLGRWAPVRLQVNDQCVECGRCARECPTGAISAQDPRRYQGAECTLCAHCLRACPTQAIGINLGHYPGREPGADLSRRRLLAAVGVGAVWVAGVKAAASQKPTVTGVRAGSPWLIRPPGALAEEEFLRRCLRCQQCVKACPTNGLQPALAEGGLDGLWTPVLVPRLGACTEHCNLCSQVCPTGAIAPFAIDEKPHLFLGTAKIDRSHCLVWAQERECLVCDEVCAYRAIEWRQDGGKGRPYVIDEICTGCGLCESACPIQPRAAIRVYNTGDKRHWSRERQRQWRLTGRRRDAGPSQ